ncbi:MAG: type II toxin-antitoxin system PemK/MazF family toxin [Ligilactobacillus ruminis]|nr:type II toxin-antitoxin system PemK/MazF family toxin [Ligilactobacillus ruminis]
MDVRRGDIFYADLSPVVGSEQGGLRPVVVIQNNIGNRFSPTVIVAAITSKISKPKMPTHVAVKASEPGKRGLEKDSVILLEQLRTIDKQRLRDKICCLSKKNLDDVDHALQISVGLISIKGNK